jgi:cysteine desulfurase/selenocysteine lyase
MQGGEDEAAAAGEGGGGNTFNDAELDEKIHGDFLISKKKIYLNNGSVAPVPISTVKAITDFYLRYSEQGPDSTESNEYLENLKMETRRRVADLINCDSDEIIFTSSTTEGINFITNGIAWGPSDKILLRNSKNEHFSNYLPWIKAANDNDLQIERFPFENENTVIEDLTTLMKSPPSPSPSPNFPRIVSTSHVMYNNGSITPVEQMGSIIKKKNKKTLFSIDGAQSVGAIEVDVKKIKCDFLSFPAFKWVCGPLGIGVLYVNKKVMNDEFEPVFVGAGTAQIESIKEGRKNIKGVDSASKTQETLKFYKYPQKYHSTFRNYPGLAGLESSIRYLLRIGIPNICKKNKKLSNIFREEISKIKEIAIHEASEESMRSSMVSFSFKSNNNYRVKTLVEKLQEKGIILAEREIGLKKIVRASPHFYNTESEIIKTINEIKNITSKI